MTRLVPPSAAGDERAAARDHRTVDVAALRERVDRDGVVVLLVGVYVLGLLVVGSQGFFPDAWLPVVAGREILAHGLPSVDHLTVLAAGRRWVDQQWLAQLVLDGVFGAGGMRLVVLVNAAVAGSAVAAAAAAARARGGTTRTTTWVLLVAVIPFLTSAATPRPQTLVYPLFVALVWLLTTDSRTPSSRVFWVLPMLVLWANLHGSVVLAAGLVTLHALVCATRDPRSRIALALAPWACVAASPYILHLPGYYRATVISPAFGHYVTEWFPTTLKPSTIPFFALAAAALYLLGRARASFSWTDAVVILVTEAGAFHARRNVVWFTLAAVVLLPAAFDAVVSARAWSRPLNRIAAAAGVAFALTGVIAVVSQSSVGTFPDEASRSVARAAGADGRVFAADLYGDWLLAEVPSLRGRVAFDSRLEILPSETLGDLVALRLRAADWQRFAREYRVFVLHRHDDRYIIRALRSGGFTSRYGHDDLVVFARAPGSGPLS